MRAPQPSSGPASVAYSSSSTLDPRSNSTMLSDRPRCPRRPSGASAQRHPTCRPPAVRCATTRRVAIRPLPQRHRRRYTMRHPYRAMPHALPSAAQVRRAVSAVEEEGGSLRAGQAKWGWLLLVSFTVSGKLGSGRLSPRWYTVDPETLGRLSFKQKGKYCHQPWAHLPPYI